MVPPKNEANYYSLRTWALWVWLDLQRWHPEWHPPQQSESNFSSQLPVQAAPHFPGCVRSLWFAEPKSDNECHPMCPDNTFPETIAIHPPFEGTCEDEFRTHFVLPFGGICIHPFPKGLRPQSPLRFGENSWQTPRENVTDVTSITPQAGKSSVSASNERL